MTLFLKECKKVLCSMTFVIFVVTLLIFAFVQGIFPSFPPVTEPVPGANDYGAHGKEVPELIMPAAIDSLMQEFTVNQYNTYPIGFYKNVTLDAADQAKIAEILSAVSNLSTEEIQSQAQTGGTAGGELKIGNGEGLATDANGNLVVTVPEADAVEKTADIGAITLRQGLTYAQFRERMAEADRILGGGSKYSETYLITNFGRIPLTYEEALENYNSIKNTDHFTAAYTRMFCDYMGILLGLLPVFAAVALCLKDRRAKMNELIFTRKTSAFHIVVSRYSAIVTMITIPTLILSYAASSVMWGAHPGESLDYLAPLTYTLGWLVPSIMISAAVGMFFTILTDTPIAIAIQGLWWFWDLNAGISHIYGAYSPYILSPRHNTIGNTSEFVNGLGSLVLNRAIFAGLAVLLILVSAVVYQQKRKGYLNGYERIQSIFTNYKDKPAA